MITRSPQILREYILLTGILILSVLVRLYRIDAPLADWHSWRQTDTSAVTRIFVKEGIDLLHPRYFDLSNIPSGLENPQGWRFVEFPIINALTASVARALPQVSLELWGRLTSIIFSLGAIVALYLLVGRLANARIALLSAAVFALMPFNIYFHRTILPEVPLLSFSLAASYFFQRWLEKARLRDFFTSAVLFATAVLIKPYVAFMGIPLLYLAYHKWGKQLWTRRYLYLYLGIVVVPFALWRLWANEFPEGIPAYGWLLNGTGIRFRPAFFRWIFAERLGKLMLGYWGLVPFALGLIRKPVFKQPWVVHWWFLAILIYMTLFATGNVTHDYYQIVITPPIAILTALGIEHLLHPAKSFTPWLSRLLAAVTLIFGFGFAWFHIRDFFNINHPEIVEAGKLADEILPEDARVIAPYGGDTAFLYQIKRQGWPIGGEIDEKIALGATDYVTVNFDEEALLVMSHCQPVLRFDGFAIVNLRNCSL